MVFFTSNRLLFRLQIGVRYPENPPFRSFSILSILGGLGSRVSSSFVSLSSPTRRDLEFLDEQVKTESIHSQSVQFKVPASTDEFETFGQWTKKEKKRELRGRVDDNELSVEEGSLNISPADEIKESRKKMRILEKEVELLRENEILKENVKCQEAGMKDVSLHSLFANRRRSGRKDSFTKETIFSQPTERKSSRQDVNSREGPSPGMVMFVNTLCEQGYLNGTGILQEEGLNFDRLSNARVQDALKSAAERFGRDHQEIAKWLSGSQLKKVALFGCPSVERKTVFAAKTLRSFFSIQEDVVCRACKLRSSCKFVNQRVSKIEKLILEDAHLKWRPPVISGSNCSMSDR
ncbi:uncharacterized protein [Aristolochia californica]|uniref:uncharacterized protein isoform X2 n=1 Tax=Aristolochia californica TaxID=171875 RepID=UPI0035D736FF